MMKKLLGVLFLAMLTTGLAAQTVREEFKANKYLAASNYLDYDRQLTDKPLTPAPEGYEPYYMSHYGRHGSRWLIADDSYSSVAEPMKKARKDGKLTAKGEETLSQLEEFLPCTFKRLGDLTTVGERQHHGIAKRMVQNFPEIFKTKDVVIDARSTVVIRCILSMTAACEELAAANPSARIHNDASQSLQYYLNQPRSGLVKSMSGRGRNIRKNAIGRVNADRIMSLLFNDAAWVKDSIDTTLFVYNLFEITTNMQSHDTNIDFYPLFTEDEIYEQWRIRNIGWYIDYGPAPLTEGLMPFRQRNLLKNIIESADTVTQTQAALRFGHEACLMPLACLMELDSCNVSVTDLDRLEDSWRNYRIYPMGCNIQIVFYRPVKGKEGRTLVKVLLNEREVSLPVPTEQYPYYDWLTLRQYYLDKLDRFDQRNEEYLKTVQE